MTEFPELTLLIPTFDRYAILKQVLEALHDRVIYPQDKLHIVVSDDSTGGNYLNNLNRVKLFKSWGAEGLFTQSTPERMGWAKHMNWAMGEIHRHFPNTQYLFFCEDDYLLTRELDLSAGVAMMETCPQVGMLRYRGSAGSRCLYHQFEADIRPFLPDYVEAKGSISGRLTYQQFDRASQTLYIYSHGPHLKRFVAKDGWSAFHDFYGLYPVGLKMGHTEEAYAHTVKDNMSVQGAPGIAILSDWILMQWDHIGKSRQGTEHDI